MSILMKKIQACVSCDGLSQVQFRPDSNIDPDLVGQTNAQTGVTLFGLIAH